MVQCRLKRRPLTASMRGRYLIPLAPAEAFSHEPQLDLGAWLRTWKASPTVERLLAASSSKTTKLVCEFACGTGDFLIAYAEQNKDRLCVGVDHAMACVERAIHKTFERSIDNLLFYPGSALGFAEHVVPEQSLDVLMVNFPDPWPKRRHHKRRILNERSLSVFVRAMKPGGRLFTATDVESLHGFQKGLLDNYEGLRACGGDCFVAPDKAYETLSSYAKKSALLFGLGAVLYTHHERKS